MTRAALSANYADLKLIKTRSVAQIVLEIDISRAEEFIAAFGVPQPGKERPVAIALLDPAIASEKPIDPQKSQAARDRYRALPEWGKAAQRAAILCEDDEFARYLGRRLRINIPDPQTCAKELRFFIGVKSRSEIATEQKAYAAFIALETEYKASVGQLAEARG